MSEPVDLFISYASLDRERVLPIIERLEAAGVAVWIDREGISGGASYALEIAEAIEQAKAIVLMCSEASLNSRNVKQEIALGWRFEKPYLPLLLETVEIPKDVAYWLETAQWVEVVDQPESEWLPKLAEALARLGIESHLASSSTRRARPLLVGRERERAVLRQHLDRMLAGHGGQVLVGGEAGIGKTTLVEDLTIDAEEQGCLVLWGHAYDLSVTPPYGPWNEIFRQYLGVDDATLPLMPPFIFDVEELAKIGSQESLVVQVAEFLQTVATARPLLLVLDDFHWFDQASLDFTRFLARQAASQRLLVVATYRSDELHRRHPLYALLPLLVREAGAERLEVRPLDELGHRALIQSRYALADADRDRLERYLVDHGEGNPLYAGELLRTLEDGGVLTRHNGHWVVGELERVRVPPMLRQVIEGRLARLPDEPRALLQVAAVIGQTVPLDLWQQVSGAGDADLVAVIEQSQSAQVLIEVGNGTGYQFRHALIREALYEEVVAPRRRLWHRTIGEVLAETKGAEPDSVAYHFLQAGDARAIGWLIKAGERAERAYVWSIAAERFERASALMTEQGAPVGEQAAVVYQLAQLSRYIDPRRSSLLLREARRLAEAAGERVFAAGCLVDDGLYQFFTGEMRDGLLAMAQGVEELDTVSDKSRTPLVSQYGLPELEFAAGSLVLALALVGRLHEAVQLGEQQIVPATPPAASPGSVGSPYADGWFGLATAYALLGRPELAQQMLAQARSVYQAIEHYFILGSTYLEELKLIQLPFAADQPAADLRRLADDALSAGRRAKSAIPANLPIETFILPLLLLHGNWDEAKAAATPMYTLEPHLSLTASETLAPLAWAQGDGVLFNRILGDLLAAGPATEPGNTYLHAALLLQRLAARMAVETSDLPTAHAWLEAHDHWLEWSDAVRGRAEGALGWAEYHHANRDLASARAAAEQALAHASDPRQPLALLAVQRFLGTLDTEAAAFDAAEAHLRASLRLADACSAPFERALTLLEIARLRMAEGKHAETTELLTEVRGICEPLEAKPTLDRVVLLERELADLEVDNA